MSFVGDAGWTAAVTFYWKGYRVRMYVNNRRIIISSAFVLMALRRMYVLVRRHEEG